jgi:hypothetical protein
MTDRAQFEAMLEALINEDQETAKEIFHNIVVAKSREIYEELLKEDFNLAEEEEEEEEEEESMEEAADDEEGADDSEDDSADDEVGGDATDDFIDDTEDDAEGEDDFGGEEEGEGELEDRVMDLEDALDELKAEFEQLMADEEGEPEHNDGVTDPEFGADDMGFDETDGVDAGAMDPNMVAEYVNKVGLPKHGDNGANTKSIVAKKNDMGGTTANIAKSFSTEKGGTEGGLAKPSAGDLTSGLGKIHNRVDSKSGKTAFKKTEPGHGPEKKGKAETADNKKSIIGGKN